MSNDSVPNGYIYRIRSGLGHLLIYLCQLSMQAIPLAQGTGQSCQPATRHTKPLMQGTQGHLMPLGRVPDGHRCHLHQKGGPRRCLLTSRGAQGNLGVLDNQLRECLILQKFWTNCRGGLGLPLGHRDANQNALGLQILGR